MKPEAWKHIEEHYLKAVDLEIDDRQRYLSEIDDGLVRHEVDSLLRCQPDERFLREPAFDLAARFYVIDAGSSGIQTVGDRTTEVGKAGLVVDSRYRILSRIAEGGTAEVYLAEHCLTKKPVAIKRLKAEYRQDDRFQQRFLEEAKKAVVLDHPNIVRVLDAAKQDGEVFVVMEYIEGESLDKHLTERCDTQQFLKIAIQCASALEEAHRKRIAHLDLKPQNIMITPQGQLKVCDFGIARNLDREHRWSFAGTPAFMAPEVLTSNDFDERADLFSLGLVFYWLLAGWHPFLDESAESTTNRILNETPPKLNKLNPSVPAEVEELIFKMLAKRPDDRLTSATQLRDQLETIRRRSNWTAEFLRTLQEGVLGLLEWGHTHRLEAAVGVMLMAVGVAASGFLLTVLPKPEFSQRDWLLIGDFENQSGDSMITDVLRTSLATTLQQSPYVNVVPQQRVQDALKRMKLPEDTPITEGIGREICLRENFKALVTGSSYKSGEKYQISARLVEASTGRSLLTRFELFSRPEDLFATVDRLAVALRSRLGESLSAASPLAKPLAQVTTRSTEAARKYSSAMDFNSKGRANEAIVLLEEALELDPQFASAHRSLARLYYYTGKSDKRLEHLDQAYQWRHSTSERERTFIEAQYYSAHDDHQRAKAALNALLSTYPDDADAHILLGSMYYNEGDLQNYIKHQRRSIELNPFVPLAYTSLMLGLVKASNFSDAHKLYNEAMKHGTDGPGLHRWLGYAYLAEDRFDEARNEFRRAREQEGPYLRWTDLSFIEADVYEGKFDEAIAKIADRAMKDKTEKYSSNLLDYTLSRVYDLLGQSRLAKAHARSALAVVSDSESDQDALANAGRGCALVRDIQCAKRVLQIMEVVRRRKTTPVYEATYQNIVGEAALAQNRISEAINAFQIQARTYPSHTAHYGLARAHAARRDWNNAAREWQTVLDQKGEILTFGFAGDGRTATLELARVYRQLGESGRARMSYQSFINGWKNAAGFSFYKQALDEWRAITP